MNNDPRALENSAFAELAVDFWKLVRFCERIVPSIHEERRTRVAAQLRYSSGRLETHLQALNLSLLTFEGEPFGPQLPAIAVNAEDFVDGANLMVDTAVEPAVLFNGKVVQNARVILKGGTDDVSRD